MTGCKYSPMHGHYPRRSRDLDVITSGEILRYVNIVNLPRWSNLRHAVG